MTRDANALTRSFASRRTRCGSGQSRRRRQRFVDSHQSPRRKPTRLPHDTGGRAPRRNDADGRSNAANACDGLCVVDGETSHTNGRQVPSKSECGGRRRGLPLAERSGMMPSTARPKTTRPGPPPSDPVGAAARPFRHAETGSHARVAGTSPGQVRSEMCLDFRRRVE